MKKFQIAYIRVSSEQQSVERQKINIQEKCPEAVFIEEKYTGTTMNRPQWNKIMASAEGGHISDLWFDEPSRMGRTADECFQLYKRLYFELNINLHFIKGAHINTEVYQKALDSSLSHVKIRSGDKAADKMINSIMKAVEDYMLELLEKQIYMAFRNAEDEAKNLSMRVKSGINSAQKRGVKFGREKGAHYRSRQEYEAMPLIIKYYRGFGGHYNVKGIAKIIGATESTTRKYIENIKVQQGLISSEDSKYADKKPFNVRIKNIDKYYEEADRIWQQRYGKKMITDLSLPTKYVPDIYM